MKQTECWLPVNGIEEFVMEFEREDAPVLIYLHGGPGESMIPFAGKFGREIDFATVVWYDQRGTGRTWMKNQDPDSISVENMLEDLHQTIAYVKEKYNADKVWLLGHSWGSYLGSRYAQMYPEDLYGYIGVGQVVNLKEGEKTGFEHLKEKITSPDEQDQALLDKIKNYPDLMTPDNLYDQLLSERALAQKYGSTYPQETVMGMLQESGTCTGMDMEAMQHLTQNLPLMLHLMENTLEDTVQYQVPVHYILGEEDWQVPTVCAVKYYDQIEAPEKSLDIIPKAGHIPALDDPDAFYGALRSVLCESD